MYMYMRIQNMTYILYIRIQIVYKLYTDFEFEFVVSFMARHACAAAHAEHSKPREFRLRGGDGSISSI